LKGNFEHKLVVVVREDIKISQGKMAAQVAHAAVSCSLAARKHDPKGFQDWFDEGQRKVVLRASSESELHKLETKARSMGLTTSLITDAGLTEIPSGTVTCLGIGPGKGPDIDKVTGSLPLW